MVFCYQFFHIRFDAANFPPPSLKLVQPILKGGGVLGLQSRGAPAKVLHCPQPPAVKVLWQRGRRRQGTGNRGGGIWEVCSGGGLLLSS